MLWIRNQTWPKAPLNAVSKVLTFRRTSPFQWCSGRDLNPQAFRHTPLKRTCLPVPPPERREKEFSADRHDWQVSSAFFLLMLPLVLVILIEIATTGVKVFEQEHEHKHDRGRVDQN